MQFSSLIAYNTWALHSLWTRIPFELSLINFVYQTDARSYLTVIIMTLYYVATVNRSGYVCVYVFFFVFTFFFAHHWQSLELYVALRRWFHNISFSTFCLEKAMWSSVWLNSCLNSVFSPQHLLIHLRGRTFTILLNRQNKVKTMAFRRMCFQPDLGERCPVRVIKSLKRWLIGIEKANLLLCLKMHRRDHRLTKVSHSAQQMICLASELALNNITFSLKYKSSQLSLISLADIG